MTSRVIHDHSGAGAFRGGFGGACGCMTAFLLAGFLLVGGCGTLLHLGRDTTLYTPPPAEKRAVYPLPTGR